MVGNVSAFFKVPWWVVNYLLLAVAVAAARILIHLADLWWRKVIDHERLCIMTGGRVPWNVRCG